MKLTIQEAYIRYLNKVNRNNTNDNVVADRGRFIINYNEARIKYLEWVLDKRNEDEIRYVQKLLVCDKKLESCGKHQNHFDFKLPDDYFDFGNIQVYGSKGECKNIRFETVFDIKNENLNELYDDRNNEPSFKYRETFYHLGSDKVKVYFKDFYISKVYLTYYRYPVPVDIEGYLHIDGTPSVNVHPELDEKFVNRVLDTASKQFDLNIGNLQKYQFDKDNIIQKI